MENYSIEEIKKVLAQFDEGYTPHDRKHDGSDWSKEELWEMLEEIDDTYSADDLMSAYKKGF